MDAAEVKATCEEIIALYKFDPEEAHIYEDVLLHRILRTLSAQVQALSPGDESDVKVLQQATQECMTHINTLLNTSRTKWYS